MIANIHHAKTNLSKLIEAAERGEEVIIARAGKPVVRLAVVEPEPQAPENAFSRGYGAWKDTGPSPAAEEWAAMDAEILADFEASVNQSWD